MPERSLVAGELAQILGVLSHPHRIMIIEELRNGQKDVNTLKDLLQISQARISQHLAIMRNKRLVKEHREGRYVLYELCQPKIAEWLLDGLGFIKEDIYSRDLLLPVFDQVKSLWEQK